MIRHLLMKLSIASCHGCRAQEYHTHHLTPIGRYVYTGRWFK
jgi:hypothetical protein